MFCFHSTLVYFTFISNNRKTVLSPKKSKYQSRNKRRSFLNKTKSCHFSFTTCFIICKFGLVYYLLGYKSKPKQGIYVSSLTEYNFHALQFLEFQNKSKYLLNILHYEICALPKVEIKNYDSFFKFALLLSGDIRSNKGSTSDVCFVCKRTLSKRSYFCTECNLRAHKNVIIRCFLIAIYAVTAKDGRIYHTIMFLFVFANLVNLLRSDKNNIVHNRQSNISENIENIVLDILLPKSKPITVGIIYRPLILH